MRTMRALPLDEDDGMGTLQVETAYQMNEDQERLVQREKERTINDIKE